MYELKPSRALGVVFYGGACLFVIIAGIALHEVEFYAAAGFAALAFAMAAYSLYKSRSGIIFDASEPRLRISNGFSAAITIDASDVVRCDLTRDNARADKITYRVGQRTKSIVPFGSDFDSMVAWAKFCNTYLDAVQSEQARADHRELIALDANPGPPQ